MPAPAHRYERVLPLPGAALIINLHEDATRVYADDATRHCTRSAAAVLGGPMLRSQIIDTAEQIRVMGVVLRHGGIHAFTAEDLVWMAGCDVDLHDLFGVTADRLRQRLLETQAPARRLELLESWLRRRLRIPAMTPAISHAIDVLNRVPQVTCIPLIARAIGMSDHRFTMQFSRQVGMKPKHYARLMRFRAVISQAHYEPAVNWSAVAADCGYADQAHLSHEFRSFAGVTPSAFMVSRGPHINHLSSIANRTISKPKTLAQSSSTSTQRRTTAAPATAAAIRRATCGISAATTHGNPNRLKVKDRRWTGLSYYDNALF